MDTEDVIDWFYEFENAVDSMRKSTHAPHDATVLELQLREHADDAEIAILEYMKTLEQNALIMRSDASILLCLLYAHVNELACINIMYDKEEILREQYEYFMSVIPTCVNCKKKVASCILYTNFKVCDECLCDE